MPLIPPPLVIADVIGEDRSAWHVDASEHPKSLTNEKLSLQLNTEGTVDAHSVHNLDFHTLPATHNRVVIDASSRSSTPIQTTPWTDVLQ